HRRHATLRAAGRGPAGISSGRLWPPADEGFTSIHVSDLVAMRNSNDGAATVLDANGADFRTRQGTIPGAVLLSNYSKYDVERELPARKDARLVFYCADSH